LSVYFHTVSKVMRLIFAVAQGCSGKNYCR
jgi:hypothetical protein